MVEMRFPTEHAEQCAVVQWLRARHVWFFAVPNGAKMGARECAKMKKEGLESGVPDLLIVDKGRRIALEMKRRNGGRVSPAQKRWLEHLEDEGWTCLIAHGAKEAIEVLTEVGF